MPNFLKMAPDTTSFTCMCFKITRLCMPFLRLKVVSISFWKSIISKHHNNWNKMEQYQASKIENAMHQNNVWVFVPLFWKFFSRWMWNLKTKMHTFDNINIILCWMSWFRRRESDTVFFCSLLHCKQSYRHFRIWEVISRQSVIELKLTLYYVFLLVKWPSH